MPVDSPLKTLGGYEYAGVSAGIAFCDARAHSSSTVPEDIVVQFWRLLDWE